MTLTTVSTSFPNSAVALDEQITNQDHSPSRQCPARLGNAFPGRSQRKRRIARMSTKVDVKNPKNTTPRKVNQGRHEAQCSLCKHSRREEIEQDFLSWKSPDKIAETFGMCRDSIYRHARAFDLLEPRRRNVRFALERIIERAGDVEVNASAVVSAIATYSKLNANGQWIDRRETIDLNDMFAKMTEDEMRRYASSGALPAWFTSVVGATAADSQAGKNEG